MRFGEVTVTPRHHPAGYCGRGRDFWVSLRFCPRRLGVRIIVDINAGLFVQGALVIGEDFE